MRHFLEVDDLTAAELRTVLALASAGPSSVAPGSAASPAAGAPTATMPLAGQGVALVFEKASNRTRNSMEMAVVQLGGHPVYIRGEEVGIGTRESAEDVVRTLAGYHALVAARVFDHASLERMAACDVAPVINMLSDQAHPMQALADLLTITQHFGLAGGQPPNEPPAGELSAGEPPLRVAFIGDANNVWRSLAIGCSMLGISSAIATPAGYEPKPGDLERIAAVGAAAAGATGAAGTAAGVAVHATTDPTEAVKGAHVVYTDVWTSMGQENEATQRSQDFQDYQVNEELMSHARADSVFMHCLPAYRGEEVSAGVIDGPSSLVWQQAENRMHAARGLLAFMAHDLMAHKPGVHKPGAHEQGASA